MPPSSSASRPPSVAPAAPACSATTPSVARYTLKRLRGHPEWVPGCFRMLVSLYGELELMEPWAGARTQELIRAQRLMERLAADEEFGALSVVLHEDRDPVGMAALLAPEALNEHYVQRHQASLCWGYTQPEHRGNLGFIVGVLVRNLLRWAEQRGYAGVTSVVEVGNRAATVLNQRLGGRMVRQEFLWEF